MSIRASGTVLVFLFIFACSSGKPVTQNKYVSPDLDLDRFYSEPLFILPLQDFSGGQYQKTSLVADPLRVMKAIRPELDFQMVPASILNSGGFRKLENDSELDHISPEFLAFLNQSLPPGFLVVIQLHHLSVDESEWQWQTTGAGNIRPRTITNTTITRKAGGLFLVYDLKSSGQVIRLQYFSESSAFYNDVSGDWASVHPNKNPRAEAAANNMVNSFLRRIP